MSCASRWLPQLLLLLLLLLALTPWAAAGDACPLNATVPAPENAYLKGDVLWAGHPERSYPPAAYRPAVGGNGYVLCSCELTPCVRKCCEPNMAYNTSNRCTNLDGFHGSPGNFTVPKFVNAFETVDSYEMNKFHLVSGKLTCAKNRTKLILLPAPQINKNFRVSETGWLQSESGLPIAPPGEFCLEQFSKHNFQILPIYCFWNETINSNIESNINIFHTIGMIMSLPFLFLTFLVYAVIKELQNLHGKSLMCHVASLFFAYASLVVVQFVTNQISNELCIILAYVIQFSFIASFFWLNVMCFDLWWTFSGFRPLRGNFKEYEMKKFIMYSIYSWGCTFIITLFTFYMASSPNITFLTIRPEFGESSCWFYSSSAKFLYFYGPIGILLFSNLLMFIYTAYKILKHMQDSKVLSGSESKKNVDIEKQRFLLYLKLFIVMGITWLAEIISWAAGSNGSEFEWYLTDIANSLQGVLIFLIFVCKKRVLKLLNKKLCPQYEFFKTTTTVSTKTTNSTFSRNSTANKDTIEMNHQ